MICQFELQKLFGYNIMKINQKSNIKKEVVTLQETLEYLRSFNEGDPFRDQPLKIKKIEKVQKQINESLVSIFPKKVVIDQEAYARQLTKNRAIKRIMTQSINLLQHYYKKGPQIPSQNSSITQFNIYLKQYNRVLDRFDEKEKQKAILKKKNTEQSEKVLQNIYNYTVIEDFKDLLQTAILNDKISKTNLDQMMEAFSPVLVVLRPNQIRIHRKSDQQSNYRSIKLYEIQNVDYHSQPYIFTLLTIVKDKSKTYQYVYFKYDSPSHQDKWDRAIFCCFMSRKMKKKTRLFQIQYPVQEEIKKEYAQIKKRQTKNYQISKEKILSKIIHGSQNIGNSSEPSQTNLANQSSFREKNQIQIKKIKRVHTNEFGSSRQDLSPQMKSSKNPQKQVIQNPINNNNQIDQITMVRRVRTNITNQSILQQQKIQNQQQRSIHNETLRPNNIFQMFKNTNSQRKQQNKQLILQKKNRKKQIEQKFKQGFVFKKQKFFFDKSKLVKLSKKDIEYWDYDEETKAKFEMKKINLEMIKSTKIKEKSLQILQQNGKTLSFIGNRNDLQEFQQWINLSKIQLNKINLTKNMINNN